MEAAGSQPPQGPAGRKRPTAEDEALSQMARQAEARLAAKRAARAEAREIRMKELERQQKEIYQVQKLVLLENQKGRETSLKEEADVQKYCDLDAKFGDIEQWMEDTECYSRKSRRHTSVSDEDERMSLGSHGSLRPTEYTYYLGSGSRTSSRASSARASPVVEERPDKDFERGVRTVSSLSAATLASLGGTSSRRGSGDTSMSVDTDASIREIKDLSELKHQIQDVEGKYMQELKKLKDSLAEVEEKYKKAMVSNAQLDNEKTNFMYQVDALKDALLELEEQLAETRRQYEERNKDFEREKHAHGILQFQFMEVKEVLKQREELLEEIQQLHQKQEGYIREISDLQETLEWKEKKIGALERQKEFFDSIISERDDLREEVNILKEQLKRHGIIYHSEVATNGETPGERLSGSSTIVPVAGHAVKVAEDGTLGRAIEMEMKNENLEKVRKREILQNTEREEHTEETKEVEFVQECLDTKMLHAEGNVEKEEITEGKVVSVLSLNSGLEEPVNNHSVHVPRIVCSLKNSDVAELKDERGLLGSMIELKEANDKDTGDVVNNINNKNTPIGPCIEANQEAVIMSEVLSQQQNKEKQKDVLVDETGTNNNDVFKETLDFVINNPTATSSQSEPLKSAEDTLTKPPEPSNLEHSSDGRESTGDKVVESDLEKQVAEGSSKISDKAEWDEKDTDRTKERNLTENAVLQQETKVSPIKEEPLCTSESAQAEFVEDEKQVEMQETQSMSLKHDLLVEEKQKEQEKRQKTKQRPALLEDVNAYSEENNEQHPMKKVYPEETVGDTALQSECHLNQETILENNSGKHREIESEFVPDGKTLAHISAVCEEAAEENHEEDNPAQVQYEPTEEQSAEEQVEIIQEPAVTEYIETAAKGDKEDKNSRKEKERQDTVPGMQDSVCLEPEESGSRVQEEKSESENEEAMEEYHEAIDFNEFPPGELNIAERNVNLGNEEEKNNQTRKEGETAEGAMQNVLKEDYDRECKHKEQVAEEDNEQTYQSSVNQVINENILTTGDENIQEEKVKESENAGHVEIDPSLSVSAKAPCEMLCSTNAELLEESNTKEIAECPIEKLDKLGRGAVDESSEETQVSTKGKGKYPEDCVIS